MDFDRAIDRNREALLRIVAALFAMVGLADDEIVAVLPRRIRRAVLLVLRPAESAARRLIFVAARDMVPEPRRQASKIRESRTAKAARPVAVRTVTVNLGLAGVPRPGTEPLPAAAADSGDAPVPAFPLFDPLKRFDVRRRRYARTSPRVHFFQEWSAPVYLRLPDLPEKPEPSPQDAVGAARLCRRLISLKRALDNLPGQAMRLARRRAPHPDCHRTGCRSPMRPGRPPGRRKRPRHEVDGILGECHSLAVYAQRRAGSS